MARITVEDCLHHCENRFELTLLAAKRARQLARGKDDPRITVEKDKFNLDKDKFTVIALREIAADLITADMINEIDKRPVEPVLASTPIIEDEDFLD